MTPFKGNFKGVFYDAKTTPKIYIASGKIEMVWVRSGMSDCIISEDQFNE